MAIRMIFPTFLINSLRLENAAAIYQREPGPLANSLVKLNGIGSWFFSAGNCRRDPVRGPPCCSADTLVQICHTRPDCAAVLPVFARVHDRINAPDVC
jgi:hypothetical protein